MNASGYGSASEGRSESGTGTLTTPGSYGYDASGKATYDQSKALSEMMQGLLTSGSGGYGAYSQPLESAILNPSYQPTSAADQALLSSVMDQTAGRGALRGLGSPTQTSLASAIAPTLVANRQTQIQNLMGGRQQDLTSRNLDMNSLLSLIQLAMPQWKLTQWSDSYNKSFGGGGSGGYGGGGSGGGGG